MDMTKCLQILVIQEGSRKTHVSVLHIPSLSQTEIENSGVKFEW